MKYSQWTILDDLKLFQKIQRVYKDKSKKRCTILRTSLTFKGRVCLTLLNYCVIFYCNVTVYCDTTNDKEIKLLINTYYLLTTNDCTWLNGAFRKD